MTVGELRATRESERNEREREAVCKPSRGRAAGLGLRAQARERTRTPPRPRDRRRECTWSDVNKYWASTLSMSDWDSEWGSSDSRRQARLHGLRTMAKHVLAYMPHSSLGALHIILAIQRVVQSLRRPPPCPSPRPPPTPTIQPALPPSTTLSHPLVEDSSSLSSLSSF